MKTANSYIHSLHLPLTPGGPICPAGPERPGSPLWPCGPGGPGGPTPGAPKKEQHFVRIYIFF